MSAELLRRFRDEGCPRALRGTLPENLAALRAHAKAGFQTYALMGRIKIGPWRHDFLTVRASRAQIT
jgi:L-amino acid N-acyltransferase YncA